MNTLILIYLVPLVYGFSDYSFANGTVSRERRGAEPVGGLRSRTFFSVCQNRAGLIQLGKCSSYFLQCGSNGQQHVVRKCPFHGNVFMDGTCQPAAQLAVCRDDSLNTINEETQRMAQAESFCSAGAGIYESEVGAQSCSAQILVCHPNRRDAISITCARGEYMTASLSCQRAPSQCYGGVQQTAPIRQFFLQRMCYSNQGPAPVPTSAIKKRGVNYEKIDECPIWYVLCKPFPTTVRCEEGQFFDVSITKCRTWTEGDDCLMLGVCRGREFTSIALGQCQANFIYCEGRIGKLFSCSPGMVFDGVKCVLPGPVGCPVCKQGERTPATKCNEFYKCAHVNNQLAWKLMRCKTGMAYNKYTKHCEVDYRCTTEQECVGGSYIPLTCDRYMYCTGTKYEEFQCRSGTRFDPVTNNCVLDPSCGGYKGGPACRPGDVISSTDCRTYQQCVNEKYVQRNCNSGQGYTETPCSHCAPKRTARTLDLLRFPATCQQGDIKAHQEDCSAYYQCGFNQWQYMRCPGNEVFDSFSGRCAPRRIAQCAATTRTQCREGERIVSPDTRRCDHLVECRNGAWTDMKCPKGTIYDAATYNCVPGVCPSAEPSYPDHLPPTEGGGMPPAPPPVENAITVGVAQSCSGQLRISDQYDCHRFWQCTSNGQFVSRTCPVGFVFDQKLSDCVKGRTCGAAVCKPGTYQPVEDCGKYRVCHNGRFVDAECDQNRVFLNGKCIQQMCLNSYEQSGRSRQCRSGAVRPHQSDKHSYMVCYYGQWTERTCYTGMVFDWQSLTCQKKQPTWKPKPPSCYPQETRPIHGQCQMYEICEYGEWVRMACPYGQRFVNGMCVTGDCNAGKSCRVSAGVDGYRRVSHDCSKYYQCVHGAWMERPCAPGTVFNERIAVCDHAANVPQCGY